MEAFNEDGYDYFPELGEEVEGSECLKACKKAYKNLLKLGYKHTDLFDKDWYNCTNVRKLDGKYYPIDVSKIVFIE